MFRSDNFSKSHDRRYEPNVEQFGSGGCYASVKHIKILTDSGEGVISLDGIVDGGVLFQQNLDPAMNLTVYSEVLSCQSPVMQLCF